MSTKAPQHPEQKDLDIGDMYTSTELFFEKNKKAVTIGISAVLLLVLGVLGYKRFIAEPKAEEARNMIWKAQYYFEIDSLDLAMNGDGNFVGLLDIAQNYGSTPSGELAHFYLGTILMQKGDFQGALDHYKEADLEDDVLSVMAVGNQGDALVELGKVDEAISQFEKSRRHGEERLHHPDVPDEGRCVAPAKRRLEGRCPRVRSCGEGLLHDA
ncbi:MAG: tetratricopeptide repeat protein [Flavobacteriales bacterium]|nr:tetratricopeptide repeat protein [Flavobacteriales bacterium]